MQSNEVVDLQSYREVDVEPDGSSNDGPQYLPAGTELLLGQYKIDGFLNCGGFGITYFAQDSLQRRVVIKECFPSELAYRSGADMAARSPKLKNEVAEIVHHFVREAHRLANVRHDNIVHVHQIFEENDTAYMAMDYVDGPDLLDVLEMGVKRFSPHAVQELTRKMLGAIKYVHDRGLLHRDISPDNILIDKRGEPVLIDFGAAREHAQKNHRVVSKLKFVKDGYSPQEFYISGSEQGAWSDLYSFAATIHHVMTGEAPPDAQTRLAALAAKEPDPYEPLASRVSGYPTRFMTAIDQALNVIPDNRLQSADDWLAMLAVEDSQNTRISKPLSILADSLSAFNTETVARQRQKAPVLAAGLGVMALLLGGAVFLTQSGDADGGALEVETPSIAQTGQAEAVENQTASVPKVDELELSEPVRNDVSSTAQALQPVPRPTLPVALGAAFPDALPGLQEDVVSEVWSPSFAALDLSLTQPRYDPVARVASGGELPVQRSEPAVLSGILDRDATDIAIGALPTKPVVPMTTVAFGQTSLAATSPNVEFSPFAVATRNVNTGLPDAPRFETRVLVDVTPPPAFLPVGQVLAQQIAFAHWDVRMPFESVSERVRSANTVTITKVDPTADTSVSGIWINEGVIIYAFNGERLIEDTPFAAHVLKSMTVDPDGYTRSTVRYRDPAKDVLDRALLAVPVVRETGLQDGTVLQSRRSENAWITKVIATGPTPNGLRVGDVLKTEATTGVEFRSHEDIATMLDGLVAKTAASASLTVLRDGSRQDVEWRLAREK